jgi:hypothetical protein
VLAAQGSYHGAAPWCTPVPAGTTPEDRAHLIRFRYNDVASLEAAAAEAGPDLAAVLLAPIRHDLGIDQELPSAEFARAARALCDRTGAALVLDEVRTGLRLHVAGSWEPLGIRPDLSAWSKAIANGHALAAVTGTDALRDAAGRIFTTGSFWAGGVAMAAGLATLAVARRDGLVAHLERIGSLFRQGLAEQAAALGIGIRQTGPVQMPLVLFDDDPAWEKGFTFCAEALRHGAYLHPKHNMFLSLAHTEAHIAQAAGFTQMKVKLGYGVDDDIACMHAIGKALQGKATRLMVDTNHAYGRADALRLGRALADFDLRWYEEPVAPEDLNGYAEMRRKLPMPIAGGENEHTLYGFRELLGGGCVDVAQPDIGSCGGISAGRHIVALAQAHGVQVNPHVWGSAIAQAASLQFIAAVPVANHSLFAPEPVLEYDRSSHPFRQQLITRPLQMTDGWVEVPGGPGLGVEVDRSVLEAYRVSA